MTALLQARILGTGMFVPPHVCTNDDLAQKFETSDEWIHQRSGIRERRYAAEGVGPADLAFEAAKIALASAQVAAGEIDLILFATLSPDYYFPGSAVFLQEMLGVGPVPALDLRAQCSGFLYGLQTAQAFIASGLYKRILLVGAECQSKIIDLSTQRRDVAVLFGDGAGAVVVGPGEVQHPPQARAQQPGILSIHLHSEGAFKDILKVHLPGTKHKPYITKADLDAGLQFPHMEGRTVFKHAVTRVPEVIREALRANGMAPDDVDFYVFHQANLRINEAALKNLQQPDSKTHHNIDRYGNCSAASIPMCLDECVRGGKIKPGDLVCMAAFGAGFTWGAALIRW